MPSDDVTLTTLNIFMCKPGITDPEVILRERPAYDWREMKIGGVFAGVLYVKPSAPSPPDWLSFLAPAVEGDANELALTTSSASAVWLIQRSERVFALTFGYGRYMLSDEGIDERFGLRCTLNAIHPEKIRSLDRKSFERVQRLTREQVSRESDLDAFGLNVEQDLLRAVAGSPEESRYGHRLAGRDALSVATRSRIGEVPELLDMYLDLSKREDYKKEEKFAWVDNIAEVGDKSLSDSLFEELVRKIRRGDTDTVWLAPPQILNWAEIRGFAYRTAKSADHFEDMSLAEYLDDVSRRDDLSVDHLSSDRVYCLDTTGAPAGTSWNVRNCLCGELQLENERFVLSEGKWYRIDQDYATRVEESVEALPATTEALPAYRHSGEEAYNEYAVEQSGGRYVLLDKRLVNTGTARGQVEVCDLFCSSECVLIHVKRYGASSVLSHLFAQGLVSARLLHMDRTFRTSVNELLPDEDKLDDPTVPIEPGDYEVAYAVVGPRTRPLQLPFFSQVNLKNAADLLREIGFRVSLTEIAHASV